MKIAHFLGYYPANCGTAKAVAGLAQGTAQLGANVHVLTFSSQAATDADREAGVNVLSMYHQGKSKRIGKWFKLFRHIAKETPGYDIVVLHGMFNPDLLLLSLFLRVIGQIYIVSPHGLYHPENLKKNGLIKRLYKPFELFILNGANAVQALAKAHKKLLTSYGVKTLIFTIPNGCEPKHEIPNGFTKKLTESETVRLLFLGRIDMHTKGLDILFQALAQLPGNTPVHLDLIGLDSNGDTARLQNLSSALNIAKKICFRGPEFSKKPVEIISTYDLLIHPSRHESFGMSIVEAMLAKTPIIVSKEAGTAEHVAAARTGWVVAPEATALAKTIQDAIAKKSEWQAMGQRGQLYAIHNLSCEKAGIAALAAYKKILARK